MLIINKGTSKCRQFKVGPPGRAKNTRLDCKTSVVGEEGVYLVIMPRSANWSRLHAVSGRCGDCARLSLVETFSIDCVGLTSKITWDACKNRVETVYGGNVTY